MPVVRDSARPLGVVYTPPEVARAMVEHALAPLIAGRTPAAMRALRICDPALGTGVFACAARDVLARHLPAADAARCIVGIDIDPDAVAAARAVLPGATLVVGDALERDWGPPAFDAVIGNPPYVRQEWLAGKPALRGFASYDGVADLYVYFIELAHRLLRPGGRYCLITPNKWLTAAYARPLRSYLAAAGSVEGVVDLGQLALFGGADAFPCIVWGTCGPGRTPLRAARCAPGTAVADALAGALPHPRAAWRNDPWHIDAPADRALIDRLAHRWPALADVVPGRPMRGVVTGCNAAFVLDRDARDRLLAAEPAAAALLRPFVKGRDVRRWTAAATSRWILLVDRGTDLAALPAVRAHLACFRPALERRKPGRYAWYELQDPLGELVRAPAPRLLYQDIQTAPACALDPTGALVPDTTVWMLPTADRYLLAVLNSPLYGWYARRRFPPALNGAVRPKRAYLARLPIATPTPTARAAIEALVDEQLRDGPSPAREAALADAVLAAYDLSARERALIDRER